MPPVGSGDAVEIVKPETIVKLNAFWPLSPDTPLSDARTVKFNVLADVGVPVIAPVVALSARPAAVSGFAPTKDQV